MCFGINLIILCIILVGLLFFMTHKNLTSKDDSSLENSSVHQLSMLIKGQNSGDLDELEADLLKQFKKLGKRIITLDKKIKSNDKDIDKNQKKHTTNQKKIKSVSKQAQHRLSRLESMMKEFNE